MSRNECPSLELLKMRTWKKSLSLARVGNTTFFLAPVPIPALVPMPIDIPPTIYPRSEWYGLYGPQVIFAPAAAVNYGQTSNMTELMKFHSTPRGVGTTIRSSGKSLIRLSLSKVRTSESKRFFSIRMILWACSKVLRS
jgi:hypothetical protein